MLPFYRLNDIVAVGPETFYTSNHHYYRPGVMAQIEVIGAELTWTYLIHYDNGKASIAVDGLCLPNGVNISPDKKYLYLYSGTDFNFRVYAIQHDGSLNLKQVLSQ